MLEKLLLEMAIVSEEDVSSSVPLANINSNTTTSLEGQDYLSFVWNELSKQTLNPKYTIDF